jgi:CheY-like chemotaxis protein
MKAMKQILVADDNKHIREFCKCELEEAGYRVVLARDGKEATRLAETGRLDLAILDINMPVMDGLEAAARIKAIAPSTPIMFFTAQHDSSTKDGRSGLAMARVIKSDDLTELKREITRLLSIPQAEQESDG